MAVSESFASICSFNCRSLKRSEVAVYDLCEKHDILLLQEHWLYPHDLSMLNYFHKDFFGFGISSVDTASNVIAGRP